MINWLIATLQLRYGNVNARLAAIATLTASGGGGSWALLNRAVGDRDARVRQGAITALGFWFGLKAIGILIAALQYDENKEVRVEAADRLVQIGQEAVMPLINALIVSQTIIDPALPAKTLVRIGSPHVVSSLITLLEAREPILDPALVTQILEEIGTPQAISKLVELREDPRGSVRQAAAETLQLIERRIKSQHSKVRLSGVKSLGIIGGSQAVQLLVQTLEDEDPEVSWEAALVLENNPNRNAIMTQVLDLEPTKGNIPGVAYLTAQYSDPNAIDRLQKHIPAIVSQLKGENPIQRLAAVKALDVIGGSEAIGALVEILNDPDDRVSYAIAKALAQRGDAATIQAKLSEWEASEKGKQYKNNEAVNTLVAANAALDSNELKRYTEDKSEETHKNIRAQLEKQLNKLLDRYAPDTFGG